jgi:DEAD/DEAH box helicase domain-containing protein
MSMKDPIGIYENLKEQYFKYIDTAFAVDDIELKKKRKEIYLPEGKDNNNVLAQEPYLELIKPYPSSGKKITDIKIDEVKDALGNNYFSNQEELELFQNFCLSGLVGKFPLYQHQIEMIKNYAAGKNCIITTGTGSGKTESFLLPLFAYLSKQISIWKQTPEATIEYNWFNEPTRHTPNGTAHYTAQAQRKNSTRKPSIKAIILYPMNALVDDQMTRLRKALDSADAEKFYRDACENHRVYFGQYNGSTPISSVIEGQAKHDELREKIKEIQLYWNKIQNVIGNGTLSDEQVEDLIYTAQKIGGSELLTRFDMQETPPDIFITNYSMLNIMLMRDREDSVFVKTKEWLQEDTENNIFHLIVDELHLNRGSSGTELALLLRLVEYRLGLHPGHPQLRVLASSASLDPQDPDSKKYITDFFGMEFNEHFKIVKEEPVATEIDPLIISKELLTRFHQKCLEENKEKSDEELAIELFGKDFLISKTNQLKQTLLKGFENIEGKHTFSLSDVNTKLFGEEADLVALKGLLKLRALYDDEKYKDIKRDLPRIRFHLFFKNVDDLHTIVGEKEQILFNSSITKVDGKKAFQNLYCDECGTLFYGGRRFENNGRLEMLPISSEYEQMPDLNLDKRPEYLKFSEFVVFWPNKLLEKSLNPESSAFDEVNGLKGHWDKALLNIHKGTISKDASKESDKEYLSGYIYSVNDKNSKALPCQCPQCAQSYKDKKFMKSPVRTFRTGYSQVTQVLASSLLKQLSPEEVDNRKLLIFSDSRSAAADLANKLERNNYSDVLRKNVFRIGNVNVDAIKNKIFDYFNTKPEQDWNWENLLENEEFNSFLNVKIDSNFHHILKAQNGEAFKNFLTPIIQGIESSNNKIIPIKNLLPSRENPGELFREFLTRGINPVGNDYKFQKNWGGKGSANWFDIYNLENGGFTDAINDPTIGGSGFHEDIQNEFIEQICNVLFGKHQFSIETMAKGFVSFPGKQFDLFITKMQESGFTITELDKDILKQIIDSLLRIFGYKYRHWGSVYDPRTNHANITTYAKLIANNSSYKRYLDAVFNVNENIQHIDKSLFVTSFLSVLDIFNPHKTFKKIKYTKTGVKQEEISNPYTPYIHPYHFDLCLLKEEDIVYKCSHCGANHGHFSAGICAHCFQPLDQNKQILAKDIWDENFYANSEEPIRMHTEELTGQTDAYDAKNRQKAFKNIFLDQDANSSNKKAEQIDVLSVTTTMEVGVDIGSLEATMMANMPPERYNYQQRVGRAGRGGQAYSIALTLCRGNSHDSYYYSNLDGMVNAKPPTPFIPMEVNSDISKRIFYKEILRDVFKLNRTLNIRLELEEPENFQDTHGEFGSYDNFINELSITKEKFISDLNIILGKEEIISLSAHLNFSKDYYNSNFTGDNIFNNIILELDKLEIKPIGLAECLAEAGLLPMYGMPTRTRSLYHNYDYKKGEFSAMSRDLEMAISEYAPGNEITKDKKIFKVEAITAPIAKRTNLTQYEQVPLDDNLFYYQTNENGSVSIEKQLLIEQFEAEDWESIKTSERKIGIIPKAYITKIYPEENTSALKPYFSVSIPRILNGENTTFIKLDEFHNLESCVHQGHIISFNEGENGEGFNFGEPSTIFRNSTDLLKIVHISARELNNLDDTSRILNYSLAANKYTSLLQIKPSSVHPNLNLSCEQMNEQQDGYELSNFFVQGVKSAVFSAAFLLRSVYTQQQDIDNSELEVLGLRHYINDDGNKVTGFSFADMLSNGSGFSKKLADNLPDYINLCLDPNGNFKGEKIQFVIDLLSENNQNNCDVADYTNLLNYRNKRFHPLLNWRLGVTYLRLLRGLDVEVDKVINADASLPEFGWFYGQNTWLKGLGVQLKEFKNEYGINSELITDCRLPFLQCSAPFENKIIIAYHPLWNKDNLNNNPLIKEILDVLDKDSEEIIFIDSFNLANRPGDCYEKLIIGGENQPNWDALN